MISDIHWQRCNLAEDHIVKFHLHLMELNSTSIDVHASADSILERLQTYVSSDELASIANLVNFIEQYLAVKHVEIFTAVTEHSDWQHLQEACHAKIDLWKNSLHLGDYLDCYSEADGAWYNAKIIEVDPNDPEHIKLHYTGWQDNY